MTLPAPIADQPYTLVADYDFGVNIRTIDELRAAFWTRYGFNNNQGDTLNDEWENYRDNFNHVINDNYLSLVARAPKHLVDGEIESGMIRTRAGFKYGYIEGRFRMPAGRSMWPAFWFIPIQLVWPPEVDIYEVVNNGRDTTRNSFHGCIGTAAGEGMQDLVPIDKWHSYRPTDIDFAEGFHTFGCEWGTDFLKWFVDGRLVRHVAPWRWLTNAGADPGPANIIANLAVGGAWPEAPTTDTRFPASLDIDYIRVWQRDPPASMPPPPPPPPPPSGEPMAITVDSITYSMRTGTENPYTFTVTPNASSGVRGVALLAAGQTTVPGHLVSATYGGVDMGSLVNDGTGTGTPLVGLQSLFLGANVPQGAQTVSITLDSATGDDIRFWVVLFLADGDIAVVPGAGAATLQVGFSTNHSITAPHGSLYAKSVVWGYTALPNIADVTPPASVTQLSVIDTGSSIREVYTQNATGAADFTDTWTHSTASYALAYFSIYAPSSFSIAATDANKTEG